jgi:hypothetical protein
MNHSAETFTKVYDILEDPREIPAIQNATLNTKDFGLVPEHGLFGSEDWWKSVESGAIPVLVTEGMITRLYMTGHNDWPEFEIDSHGQKSSWTRRVDLNAYHPGKQVRVEYVNQKPKKDLLGTGVSKVVLRIWVDNT